MQCNANTQLKSALRESLKMPIDLLCDVFKNLKETTFDNYEPANNEQIDDFLRYLDVFDGGI